MQHDKNQSDYISRAGGGVSNPHGIRRARGTEQKRCASGIHSVVATKGENPLGLSYREVGQAVAETLTRRCYCEHDCCGHWQTSALLSGLAINGSSSFAITGTSKRGIEHDKGRIFERVD